MKALILAGGGGTRLWPVSRKNNPKQIKPFIDDQTLLQKTYNRLGHGFAKADIFLCSNIKYKQDVKHQLPNINDEQLIFEPFKKDTAAAIGLTAMHLYHIDPQASLVTIMSDHHIEDEAEYLRVLSEANKLLQAKPGHTIMIGINPQYAETGYGYIKMGKPVEWAGSDEVFATERFIEKPDKQTAEEYLKKWQYLWNPALFVWRVEHLLSLFAEHLPDTYAILKKIADHIDQPDYDQVLAEEFAKITPISIDYGILEKLNDKMLVMPADFGWTDIGHWSTIHDVLANSNTDNIVKGKHVSVDSRGNLIYSMSDKLVATAGVNNMIIIETEDALLICPKDRAQDVKKIVQQLEKEKLEKYL